MNAWSSLLAGAAETETLGGARVGAMIGARGCVSYGGPEVINPTTALPIAGTGIYTVMVAWQGLGSTAIPTLNCANTPNTLYGTDAQRRVTSFNLRIASLL